MKTERETPIMQRIRAALLRTRLLLLWRNMVGTGYATSGGQFVVFGLGKGSADLVGFLKGSGRFFAVEVKTPAGRLSKPQRAWHRAVRGMGGFCAVARSPAEALGALERALEGRSE
jgi:hypothetical protein